MKRWIVTACVESKQPLDADVAELVSRAGATLHTVAAIVRRTVEGKKADAIADVAQQLLKQGLRVLSISAEKEIGLHAWNDEPWITAGSREDIAKAYDYWHMRDRIRM